MKLLERDALLDRLEGLLRGVAGGTGHVALVGGEAGIGKTSLLGALTERCSDVAVWWGSCDALQTPHPLAPLFDIARSVDVGFRPMITADADRAALFEAVLAELQQARGAILLVVEDAHWADEATLDLLKFLGRRIDRTACLLVVSYRDDEIDATHPLRRLMGELPGRLMTRLEIPRLSAAAVDSLARSALRAPRDIHAITQGNPLFVTELLRHGLDGVPRGVQDLVLARFARLGAKAQDIVRLVSIVPSRIERWLVDAVLAPHLDTLEECLNSGLLLASTSTLAFRHELVRVAVEQSLSATLAQSLHVRVLEALERKGDAQTSLARRVHHAARAGDAAAVLRLAPAAAGQARRRGAHKEAAAHLCSALEHGQLLADTERARLLDELSYEYYLTDRIADALVARASSQQLWRAAGDAIREGDALRWLSRLSWYNGQTGPAERHASRAIEVLETQPAGRELAMAYSNRSQLHMVAGESAQAQAWGSKALQLAAALGDRETEVHALNNIGTSKLDDGDAAGRGELERSLDLALGHGFEEHAARAFTNLSYNAVAAREYARAMPCLERGIAYCEEHDLDSWARYMTAYRGEAWMALGEWDRAADDADAVLRTAHVAPITRVMALVVLGRIRARRGDPDSQRLLDEALQLALPAGGFLRIGCVTAARAEAAWLRGDVGAIAAMTRLFDWSRASQSSHLRWVSGEIAWWLHRAGALEAKPPFCPAPYALQIDGRWREAAAAWQQIGSPYEQAQALGAGDVDAQREALAQFERLGARLDAERMRRQLHAAGVRGLPRGQRASTQANPHELTSREIEVLRLLCEGLKNSQIAARLSRSVRTVDHHLAAVFAKLGVATRTEAVAAAQAAGIGTEKKWATRTRNLGKSAEGAERESP